MLRLFICVWIPNDLRGPIVDFQKEIMKLPMKAKFVEPENLHFTITFIGKFEEKNLKFLKDKLDDSVKNMKKFHVKLEGLKIIPNENYIRVIGINIKDEKNISSLIKKVGKSIDGKYYEAAKLTLCRVKKIYDKQAVKSFIKEKHDILIGDFEIENVSLVKSTLTKRGPIYETIHKSMLK
ncbi:MAG: RNA 2',3'-cyclic phosphodiesterase [Methanosarcinales archaeon]